MGGTNWLLSGNSGIKAATDFLGTVAEPAAPQPLVIKTNGVERMRIDEAGNVGIGTPGPASKLEIAGTAGNLLWVGASTGSTANIDLSGHVQLREYSKGGIAYLQARDDRSNRDIALRIRTQKAGTSTPSITEAATIDANGNVGIGNKPPDRNVTVYRGGGVGVYANLKNDSHEILVGVDNAAIVSAMTNSDLQIRTNNNPRMVIKAGTGNVGIGTTSPATPLHVGGPITTGTDFSSAGAITFRPPDGFAYFHIDNGAVGRPNGRLRVSIGVNPGDIELISILQDGNVGIGTASPKAKLELSGTGVVRSRVNSDSNSGVGLALQSQPQWSVATVLVPLPPIIIGPGAIVGEPGAIGGGPGGIKPPPPPAVRGNFQIYNDRVGQNALYIDGASLNVGIGTTEPSVGTLQVNGNVVSARASDGTNAGFFDWCNLSSKKRWHLTMRSGDGDKLQLYHNDGSSWSGAHLNINPDGNVGIGTSSPGAKLEVNGDVKVSGDILLTNADCAEDFDIVDADQVEPGTVMVIDQEGALRQSYQAYDKRVAGVTSGAGDYKPGIVLDKHQSQDDNRMPIALVGKVYCRVDAQYSPIEVGDLLTTSATPGHAMKAEDALRAFGAVIGKALRPLRVGQGLIPILIALQ